MIVIGKLIHVLAGGTEQPLPPLRPGRLTIGRDESNDIVLSGDRVSRFHARLECDEQGCLLTDTNSANGVVVDGEWIEQTRLAPGSMIQIGENILRYEVAQAEAAGAAAEAVRPRRTANRQLLAPILEALELERGHETLSGVAANLRDNLRGIARLAVHSPDSGWREIALTGQNLWTIGRNPQSDIAIPHQKVSFNHARISRQGDGFLLEDLNSTNGTWLGTQRVGSHRLVHGDTIQVGNSQFIFKNVREAPVVEAAGDQDGRHAPVVVIPGTFGSGLWRGSQQLWPSVRTLLMSPESLRLPEKEPAEARGIVGEMVIVPKLISVEAYDRIGNYLESALHYRRGRDLLEFAFDWRADLRLAAQKLAATVDGWPVNGKVTLIAHSMGCLVARYYVNVLGGHRKVGRLVLMGGPNYGIAGGLASVLPASDRYQLPALLALGGPVGRRILDLFATFPAIYKLLPTFPAVFDQHGRAIDVYEDDAWLPPERRPLLHSARDFHRQLGRRAAVPTVCIFGYGTRTITRLNVERERSGQWQSVDFVSDAEGDGTVETSSAVLDGAEIHPVQQGHNALYTDADVMMRLKLDLMQ